jgi:hypothetical protein
VHTGFGRGNLRAETTIRRCELEENIKTSSITERRDDGFGLIWLRIRIRTGAGLL